jgi:hypothetical protein
MFKLLTENETWQTILKGNIPVQRYYHRFLKNQAVRIFCRIDGHEETALVPFYERGGGGGRGGGGAGKILATIH